MIERSALKLSWLNIGGNAKLKCMTDDIQKIIKEHDVFVIVESWLDSKDRISRADGYINFRSDREKQSRASGGIIVYCKSTLAGAITMCASKQNDVMWIKFDQIYFGLEKYLYIYIYMYDIHTTWIFNILWSSKFRFRPFWYIEQGKWTLLFSWRNYFKGGPE